MIRFLLNHSQRREGKSLVSYYLFRCTKVTNLHGQKIWLSIIVLHFNPQVYLWQQNNHWNIEMSYTKRQVAILHRVACWDFPPKKNKQINCKYKARKQRLSYRCALVSVVIIATCLLSQRGVYTVLNLHPPLTSTKGFISTQTIIFPQPSAFFTPKITRS